MLLILDNCEHLVQASAQLADALLHACPEVHIITTSREMLGMAGERAFYVPSLAIPDAQAVMSTEAALQSDAVRLFIERAHTVTPQFALTDENVSAVIRVCQRLDGIPLAIELATARLKMLPVQQIADHIDDAFRLLTGGSRTAMPRHQTLQALMDWSYNLLTELEQALLRRLAVFAGGWSLEAAEAVGAGEDIAAREVFDLLARLVDKSLVLAEEQGGVARYRLLETVRQYALAKLAASSEADAVRRQHAEYYLGLAEVGGSWTTSFQPAWLDRMEMEHDNLRAALTWSKSVKGSAELGLRLAGAVMWFCFYRGYWNEARGWLDAALAHSDAEGALSSQARAEVLLALGDDVGNLGKDYAARQSLMSQSLKLFQELGDRASVAWVLHRLGWLAREHGDTDTARLRLEESMALFRELGGKAGLAWVSVTLGEVAVMQEDAAWATALLEEGLALSHQLDDRLMMGWAFNHLGHIAQIQGEYERARQLHKESLVLFDKIGARNDATIWVHQSLGEIALGLNDSTLATTHFTEALELSGNLGYPAGTAWCLAGLAGVAAVNEEPERAAWLWGAAEALRQSIGAREAPASRATHERLQAEVRRQLGEASFDAKWAEGQTASVKHAIAEALAQ